jgi:hypothetical protein
MRSTIRRLIIAATLVNGLLASGSINRNVVDMPAWREVGPLGWAAFSRRADLGWRAMIVYPSEAFAGMILSVAAAALFWRDRTAPRAAAVPMYAAALLTISGLLFTINAAQIMLSVRHLGDDPIALRRAFDGFEFWGWWRGVCQCSAYLASFWAHIERRHGREKRRTGQFQAWSGFMPVSLAAKRAVPHQKRPGRCTERLVEGLARPNGSPKIS